MKNLFAEAILIFLSVLASFTVDGFRKEVKEKEELNEALYTLSKEMTSNISYAQEHLKQLENMLFMTNFILDHFDDYSVTQLKEIHNSKPFMHYFDTENNLRYLTDYQDVHFAQFFLWWNAWKPNDILYTTLANSGKLLEIEDEKIMQELESIYTKQKERNEGMTRLRQLGSERLFSEQLEKMKEMKLTSFIPPYYQYRNHNLYIEMLDRKVNLEGGIGGINDYIASLERINTIIRNDYGSLTNK